mgnify:FL=1
MNEIQIFNNKEFGNIRTVNIDGEPWFVGKDVANALGYTNPQKAVRDHISVEDRGVNEMDTPSGKQNLTIINESGLYALIFGSKLESAQRFKHWVTSDVLPVIRKTGGYQTVPQGKELLALAVLEAQKTIEEQNHKIREMQPKAIFADAVSASETSILVGDLAKLICQNGYQIGQKRLFEWLRQNGYLMKCGSSRNMPTQRYLEQGLFEVKESNVQNPDGSIRITRTTKITGRGQLYFVNKFLGRKEE